MKFVAKMIGGPRHGAELGFDGPPPPFVTYVQPPYSEHRDSIAPYHMRIPVGFDIVRLTYERILEQPPDSIVLLYAYKGRS